MTWIEEARKRVELGRKCRRQFGKMSLNQLQSTLKEATSPLMIGYLENFIRIKTEGKQLY